MMFLPVSAVRKFNAQRLIFKCFGVFINQNFTLSDNWGFPTQLAHYF